MITLVPLPSKITATRLEVEEEEGEGTTDEEEEGPSRVQIPHPLVPTLVLTSLNH